MSMSTVLTLPAPGWYPDPVGASAYRWWDGAAWTEGTHDGRAEQVTDAVETPSSTFAYGDAVFEVEPEPLPLPQHPLFSDPGILKPTVPLQPAAPQAPQAAARPARSAARAAKTRWSSMLVAFPFVYPIALGMIVALAYAGGSSTNMMSLAVIGGIAAIVLLAPAWIIAENDRKDLVARGYEPAPSLAWMLLLPPLVYLLMRRRVVGPSF